ncbi:hypothetical protein GCM10022243_68200 [Saccharothrix violaceirubra]|uniref:DUF4178 domain-containing protein n=1 Tax=Saccharothrix violaceirubra TaxID=413306 RepID=A0A7W7T6H4_9PSEU|nr:hypothetical protein [Saccharothrix violaceirubra]MBB4967226.1 hypothetical protein [Saccharothrix violaceirubra]
MLKEFVEWFDDQLMRRGVSGIFHAVLGILSLGAVASAVFGGTAVKVAAVLVAVIVLLAAMALLASGRKEQVLGRLRDDLLIGSLVDAVTGRSGNARITMWEDVAQIDSDGNVVETVTVFARAETGDVRFYRLRVGPGWNQPKRQRAKVVCEVVGVRPDGGDGPRYDLRCRRLVDGRLETVVTLPDTVKVGQRFRVRFKYSWPGMCEPLMVWGQPEDFRLRFAHAVEGVRYTIVLPAGREVRFESIGFDGGDSAYAVEVDRDPAGAVSLSLTARNVPAKHTFGTRLDLDRTTRPVGRPDA